jgi:outer membrane protein assembly factor BamB
VVAGGTLLAGYEPATGEELWSCRFYVSEMIPSIVVQDDVVFWAGNWGAPRLGAIRIDRTGSTFSATPLWETNKLAPVHPSPLVIDDRIYTITDNGVVVCREALTGKEIWKRRVGGGDQDFRASPVSAEGHIYFLGPDGEMIVTDAGPSFREIARNSIGEPCFASPAIANQRIYLRTEQNLWCISQAAGAAEVAANQQSN